MLHTALLGLWCPILPELLLFSEICSTTSQMLVTVLQAFAQVQDLHVWYGPDTYMGKNLAYLMQALSMGTDEQVLLR